jgi:hypothetical protein
MDQQALCPLALMRDVMCRQKGFYKVTKNIAIFDGKCGH